METITVLLDIDDDAISLAAGLGVVGDALDVGINILSSDIAEDVGRIEGTDLSGASEVVIVVIVWVTDSGKSVTTLVVVVISFAWREFVRVYR